MKHVNLIYKLSGDEEKINEGLSVFEIAPILLSVGELIKKSNQIIRQDRNELSVNVKPFRKGSFIIDVVIFAQNRFNELLEFIKNDQVREIKELLEWIGLISAGGVSLYHLIKFLKGKPKAVEQISPNEIKYTSQENNSIVVTKEVHQLFQDCNIQNVIYNALGRPLEQDGITKVTTFPEDNPEQPTEFTKKEAEYLKNYSDAIIPSLVTEEAIHNNMKAYLIPKRGSFDGDPRQWSFRMSDSVITATIKDDKFLARCKNGDIRPNHKDILLVDLIQKIKKVNGKLDPDSISFEVEKVIEYQKGGLGEQSSFNLTEDN